MSLVPSSRRRLALLALALLAVAGCDRSTEPVACTPDPASSAPLPTTPASAPPAPAAPPSTIAAVTPAHARAAADPAPEAAPPRATDLRVKRLVLAEGVEAREPVSPRRSFTRGALERVYAFVEVENPERLPGAIVVSFEPPEGPALGNVRLAVGASPRWRTWAFSRAVDREGEWTAVVRDAEGRVLAREPFAVTL